MRISDWSSDACSFDLTDHLDNRLVFISALWVALTTAILCAILPAGLPLTKAVGSAFSPSTTIVALRATAEQVRDTERHLVKGDTERLTNPPLPKSQNGSASSCENGDHEEEISEVAI